MTSSALSALFTAALGSVGRGRQSGLFGRFRAGAGGFVQCPDFTMAALEPLIDETAAGIVIEPVQGEGGVRLSRRRF